MKTLKNPFLPALFFFVSVVSCSSPHKEEYIAEKGVSDSTISSAAAINNPSASRSFIRTAELKFRASNVSRSVSLIENLAVREGGFVVLSNLSSSVTSKKTERVSADSSVEITHYMVENELELRVPVEKLDTVLKFIQTQAQYLDYRIIKAEEVTLVLKSNRLAEHRLNKYAERITTGIKEKGKKLKETAEAEERLLNTLEQHDAGVIQNLALTDNIRLSTIKLSIYQPVTITRRMIENENLRKYEPGFISKGREALLSGWYILEELLLLILRLWSLLVLGAVVYMLYKFVRARLLS